MGIEGSFIAGFLGGGHKYPMTDYAGGRRRTNNISVELLRKELGL